MIWHVLDSIHYYNLVIATTWEYVLWNLIDITMNKAKYAAVTKSVRRRVKAQVLTTP